MKKINKFQIDTSDMPAAETVRNFAFEDFKPMEVKDGIQARIFWMGQLTCSNPRMQGLLVGGATGY